MSNSSSSPNLKQKNVRIGGKRSKYQFNKMKHAPKETLLQTNLQTTDSQTDSHPEEQESNPRKFISTSTLSFKKHLKKRRTT